MTTGAYSDHHVKSGSLKKCLSGCLPSSGFFLFHNVKPLGTADELVTNVADVPSFQPDCETYPEEPLVFNDYYDISTPQCKEKIDCYANSEEISWCTVIDNEPKTRGQSQTSFCRDFK